MLCPVCSLLKQNKQVKCKFPKTSLLWLEMRCLKYFGLGTAASENAAGKCPVRFSSVAPKLLWSVSFLNPFTHGCVAFCVHQWKVQRKREMWIREIWESIFVDETDEEDRTTPPSCTYQLSLSLDVAPQRAPRRLPKQLEVSLPLQGSLRWIGELADLGGGIIAAVAEGSKRKSCSFSVVGPPRSSVGASCNSCLTPRVSCFALLY